MRGRMLGPGYHVAPFLSPNGKLVLLAMDIGGRLLGMAEVTRMIGRHSREDARGRYTINDAAQFRSPRESFGPRLWHRGVYVAPWRNAPADTVLVAVDGCNRLVATMTANGPSEVPGVRRDLGALLDTEPSPLGAL